MKALVTGFDPFGRWKENSSRLCIQRLQAMAKELPVELTTRIYPVDFKRIGPVVKRDLWDNYDIAIHLGQSAKADRVMLETIGLNIKVGTDGEARPLLKGAPLALETSLPVGRWEKLLTRKGIPCAVSYHAGTYLCNAALFLSLYHARLMGLKTRCAFVHLPLDPVQARGKDKDAPSLSAETGARAVGIILRALAA